MQQDQGRGGRVKLEATPARVLTAARATASHDPGEPVIVVGLGDSFADADFLAFTFPEAQRLLELVTRALGHPTPEVSIQ